MNALRGSRKVSTIQRKRVLVDEGGQAVQVEGVEVLLLKRSARADAMNLPLLKL